MNPESAIRTIRRSKHPYAVALADEWGFDLSLVRLTPTKREVLERWLDKDAEYQSRFVGVYDRSSSYADMMEDVVFTVNQRCAA